MTVHEFGSRRVLLTTDRVAALRINRPEKRNAMSEDMWSAVIDACVCVAENREVRVLIVSGIGVDFCAGADISEFDRAYASQKSADRFNSIYRQAETALRDVEVPVIAEMRGVAYGGGLGLALAADFRFADSTTSMAVTASKLGIAYGPEDMSRLIEKVGLSRAKDMLFSGKTVNAQEALSYGLVDRISTPDGLSSMVMEYAEMLAERSSASLKAMKAIANGLAKPDVALCDALRPRYSELFLGGDAAEGRQAFIEKRDPRF
jgi:enoyl-CoA hydratase